MSISPMQNANQFGQQQIPGMLDARSNPDSNVLTCRFNPNSAITAGIPGGQPLKLVDLGAGDAGTGLPVVDVATGILDTIIGFSVTSPRFGLTPPGQPVQVATDGTVMWLMSSGALTRGQTVYADPANPGAVISTVAKTAYVAGFAMDKATAANQLIRVMILASGTKYSGVSSS